MDCKKYLFSLALLIFISSPVYSAINITGQYSGQINGFVLGSPPQPQTQNLIINITNQVGNNFIGSFILLPSKRSTSFTGTFVAPDRINVICNGSSTIVAGPCFAAQTDGARIRIPDFGQPGSMVISSPGGSTAEFGGLLNKGQIVKPSKAPSTSIKDAGTIKSEVLGVVTPIQQHLIKSLKTDAKGFNLNPQGFLLEGESGLNSGDIDLGNIGVWLSYNYRDVENDFAATAFESTSHTAIGGIDYSPREFWILGVAFAYEYSDTDTIFNAGNLKSDGYTVAPYLGVLLDDTWSIDASIGISSIKNDQFRTDPDTAARISSDPETDRFFAAVNINGITYYDNWILGGRIGYVFAKSVTEEFTESDTTVVGRTKTRLGQLRIGGDVAYSFGNWEPFISATYEFDQQFEKTILLSDTQPANDRDDIFMSTGFRYFNKYGVSGSFEYSKRFLREDFDEDSITVTFRYDF